MFSWLTALNISVTRLLYPHVKIRTSSIPSSLERKCKGQNTFPWLDESPSSVPEEELSDFLLNKCSNLRDILPLEATVPLLTLDCAGARGAEAVKVFSGWPCNPWTKTRLHVTWLKLSTFWHARHTYSAIAFGLPGSLITEKPKSSIPGFDPECCTPWVVVDASRTCSASWVPLEDMAVVVAAEGELVLFEAKEINGNINRTKR